jgi:hypothetical protein
MGRYDGLKPAKPGEIRNPKGRGKGVKNRSTIARELLDIITIIPDKNLKAMQMMYPHLTKKQTAEAIMTLVQINKAIVKEDTAAYNAVMASAYGMPTNLIQDTNNQVININIVSDEQSDDQQSEYGEAEYYIIESE